MADQADEPMKVDLPAPRNGDEVRPSAEATLEAVEAAMEAAEHGDESPFGRPGRPFNRRSPFFMGMAGAAGVAVTYAMVQLLISARGVLVLIGLALFIAIGLDPAVAWLARWGLPRWAAVVVIAIGFLAMIGGFLALAIPPLAAQTTQLVDHLPQYSRELQNHNSQLGKLNDRFQVQQHIAQFFGKSGGGSSVVGGLLGAGQYVLSAVSSTFVVVVLTLYFLGDLDRIKVTFYRCFPQSRRARIIIIGDDVLSKVGAYVLGNLFTSVIAGAGTTIWLEIFHVPYAILLGVFVAIMDLVPVVGSTVGGVVVSLIALTVSLPIAIATVAFYIVYRLVEDYLLVPRIMGRAVEVPGVVTVIAVLIGGALLGLIGALVAIPFAAALRVILREVAFPRLDNT